MEFLDPEKERRTRLMLFVGYALIALAIGITSLVLLYWSSGFSVNTKGDVLQSGLVFVSSEPSGADISFNGAASEAKTDAKINLESGNYILKLSLAGYSSWQHPLVVRGGDVQRIDYPQLFPTKLTTETLQTLKSQAFFVSQSLDRRMTVWMQQSTTGTLTIANFKKPAEPTFADVVLPTGIYTASTGAQAWSAVEWSSNNRHLLVKHDYTTVKGAGSEYILIDTDKIDRSQNLTKSLSLQATETLTLFDKKPDKFYAYNSVSKVLRSFTADGPLGVQIPNVRAYKTYADTSVLYVTDTPPGGSPTAGRVSVVLQQGSRSIVLRQLADSAQAKYLLDIAEFSSNWYVVAGTSTENGVYIYKDPQTVNAGTSSAPAAWRFLRVKNPTYVAFSANARFILAENSQNVAVYDADTIQTFVYTLAHPLDAPQTHIFWKDGHRLTYVSNGKLIITEFDNYNTRELQAASPVYEPLFSDNSRYGYAMTQTPTSWQLTSTPYVIPK